MEYNNIYIHISSFGRAPAIVVYVGFPIESENFHFFALK